MIDDIQAIAQRYAGTMADLAKATDDLSRCTKRWEVLKGQIRVAREGLYKVVGPNLPSRLFTLKDGFRLIVRCREDQKIEVELYNLAGDLVIA
jgi:hypothetical protein